MCALWNLGQILFVCLMQMHKLPIISACPCPCPLSQGQVGEHLVNYSQQVSQRPSAECRINHSAAHWYPYLSGQVSMWMFRCLCESCFTGRWCSFWSCLSSSCMHTGWWSICHTTGDFQWLLKLFLSAMIVGKKVFECATTRKISIEALSGWDTEYSRREVISWHLKECPDWIALGLCSVCCGSTISFALGQRDCYKVYLLMPCLLSSACVFHSLFTQSGGFSYSVDWRDSIFCILLCQIKNDAEWLDSNIVLSVGQFALQATVSLLKQWVDNDTDASPSGMFTSYLL